MMTWTSCCVDMVLKVITINCDNGGERLDVFLANNLPGYTRSSAARLIGAGQVMLRSLVSAGGETQTPQDRAILKKNYLTSRGEVFAVQIPEPESSEALPQALPLDIVFEDSDIIVINKPRGMVVHPAPGHNSGTLVNALLSHCGDSLSGIGGVKRPGIVHRLDKLTTGLIIAAKNDRAHLILARQLAARKMTREYEAIVRGVMKDDTGTIDAPIGRHPKDRKRNAVTEKNSRPAVTHYEVKARFAAYTHLICRLETGRTHQIRVHLAHIGRPVVGDTVYGQKKPEFGLDGQCLHAFRLVFTHPTTEQRTELTAPLPDYFLKTLETLQRLPF